MPISPPPLCRVEKYEQCVGGEDRSGQPKPQQIVAARERFGIPYEGDFPQLIHLQGMFA